MGKTFAQRSLPALLGLLAALPGAAADLYRYQDAQGNWHFTDRPPADAAQVKREQREAPRAQPTVSIRRIAEADRMVLRLQNTYLCPVEVMLEFTQLSNVVREVEAVQQMVLEAGATGDIVVPKADLARDMTINFQTRYLPGDPQAQHRPPRPYRLPYALSSSHQITQGFNDRLTHLDPSSFYAIDIGMPVGTGIFAARAGLVVETAYANYAGGTDRERDGPRANIIRILHDDGTFAVYAHLDRASVRVSPGDEVQTGQYIADAGNTGFSSGPHLHFAVMKNTGMQMSSLQFSFSGLDGRAVQPKLGDSPVAYR